MILLLRRDGRGRRGKRKGRDVSPQFTFLVILATPLSEFHCLSLADFQGRINISSGLYPPKSDIEIWRNSPLLQFWAEVPPSF